MVYYTVVFNEVIFQRACGTTARSLDSFKSDVFTGRAPQRKRTHLHIHCRVIFPLFDTEQSDLLIRASSSAAQTAS